MKIRELDLDQYVIVYDMGKSEKNNGMTVVGRVEEIVFNDDGENAATINSLGNLYDITDDNYFDLWTKSIEDKTEHIGFDKENTEKAIKLLSNDVQQRKRKGVVTKAIQATIQPGEGVLSHNTVNHPSHYNYGEIEVIDFIEQVTQHYNPNVAYHIGNAIKYLARSPHKNGKEDVAKAKWYIERAYDKWDVK
ncbi:DUF3310 domain-containing protein [Staphylococcus equorum]|uniref:DUF3310 domain-containing protein n=1 Tax=Staphylococcus equorum TaxID=246432 RepID=UPI002553FD1D|nr:DUF3310 domain-containing protein [Staphylococcus equorum]MDK9844759.1 DUF3310 domain-containing protein [Staphylococcus equorum]